MFQEDSQNDRDSNLKATLERIYKRNKTLIALEKIRERDPQKVSSKMIEFNSQLSEDLSYLTDLIKTQEVDLAKNFQINEDGKMSEISVISIANLLRNQDLNSAINQKKRQLNTKELVDALEGLKSSPKSVKLIQESVKKFSKAIALLSRNNEEPAFLDVLDRLKGQLSISAKKGFSRNITDDNGLKISDLITTYNHLKSASKLVKNDVKKINQKIRAAKNYDDSWRSELEEAFKSYERIKEAGVIKYADSEVLNLNENQQEEDDEMVITEDEKVGEDTKIRTKKLSPEAEEFFPKEEKESQIRNFLRGARIVRSIDDLPVFLQSKLTQILEQNDGSYAAIKGTAARPRKVKDTRDPHDLDLELFIKGVSSWSEERINNLSNQIIPDIDQSQNKMIRRDDEGRVIFFHSKDDAGLDLSIYDSERLPNQDLSWVTTEDMKMVFNADGTAQKFRPLEDEIGFQINPKARNLVFRVAFEQTINGRYVNNRRVIGAMEAIYPYNPIDYLFFEFGLNRNKNSSEQEEILDSQITKFCDKHALDSTLQKKFISNLSWLLMVHNLEYENPVFVERYSAVYRLLDSKMSELNKEELRIDESNEQIKPSSLIKSPKANSVVEERVQSASF